MHPSSVYAKTKSFCRLRFLYAFLMTVLATLFFAVIVVLPALASPVLSYCLIPVWLIVSVFVCKRLYRSVFFRAGVGHLGIMIGVITMGELPENPILFGSEMVRHRYGDGKHYHLIERTVSRAVIELHTRFSEEASLIGDIQGMHMLVVAARFLGRIALSPYVSCCIAYTFYRNDVPLTKAAAEAVAVFSMNWKKLAKNASDYAMGFYVAFVVLTAALSVGFYFLLGLISITVCKFFCVPLALMLLLSVKYAYVDPLLTCNALVPFVACAGYTVQNEQYYRNLCKLSPAFRRLIYRRVSKPRKTVVNRQPIQNAGQTRSAQQTRQPPLPHVPRADAARPLVCRRCHTGNAVGAQYCAGCGAPLRRS